MKVSKIIVAAVAGLITTGVAQAQSFNIDFGNDATAPTPSAAFGAAAGQAGTWNQITSTVANAIVPLVGLNGAATAVTFSINQTEASFFFNNTNTTGDFQNLLDDALDLGGVGSTDIVTISGLQNGNYQVYTYAGAPDSSAFITSVNVNGTGAQNVGGVFPVNGFAQGITHSLHNVVVTNGTLTVNLATVASFGTLSGMQIVGNVPAPGALALLGMAGLVGRRRRSN